MFPEKSSEGRSTLGLRDFSLSGSSSSFDKIAVLFGGATSDIDPKDAGPRTFMQRTCVSLPF